MLSPDNLLNKRYVSATIGHSINQRLFAILKVAGIHFKEIREPMARATKKATSKTAKKVAKKTKKKASAKPSAKKSAAPSFYARPAIEITATFPDRVGMTAKVAAAIAAEKVNILAGTGYSSSGMRRNAIFTLIVDDFTKAEKALDKIGADDIQESSVVLVDMANKVGALERASGIIADAGINIFYFYATTSSGKTATCVFRTADDKETIRLLNKA